MLDTVAQQLHSYDLLIIGVCAVLISASLMGLIYIAGSIMMQRQRRDARQKGSGPQLSKDKPNERVHINYTSSDNYLH